MDYVHFLNIEYFLVRFNGLFSGIYALWNGGSSSGGDAGVMENGVYVAHQAGSQLVSNLWFAAGQFALLGTAIAIILLAMSLYIRIKLEVFEHEQFHAREAQYHTHDAHHGEGHAPVEPKEKSGRWEEVATLASSTHESDWRRAIMEADIMLAELLDSLGYRGQSIGDKLKDANPLQFTTLGLAWRAHKIRNEIAHSGEGFHLSERETKDVIDSYKQVFEEFKFI